MRVRHVFRHGRSIEQSRALVERAFAHYAARFAANEPTLRWITDARGQIGFDFSGDRIEGELVLRPGATEVVLRVPLALAVFKAPAVRAAESELRRLLTEADA